MEVAWNNKCGCEGRNDEHAGQLLMKLVPPTLGASPDRLAVDGGMNIVRAGFKMRQKRRFEFIAPAHINWPVLNDKVRA